MRLKIGDKARAERSGLFKKVVEFVEGPAKNELIYYIYLKIRKGLKSLYLMEFWPFSIFFYCQSLKK